MNMGTLLKDLPGTSKKETEAEYVVNAKYLKDTLKAGKAATNAGYNGAWNIWKDNEGYIRGQLMQFLKSIGEERKTKKISEAQGWIREWNKFITQ